MKDEDFVGCAVRTRNTLNSIPARWNKPHACAWRTLHKSHKKCLVILSGAKNLLWPLNLPFKK
jgi:hypothetical protein